MPSVGATITMPFSASFDVSGAGTLETVKQQTFQWDISADETFVTSMSLDAFKNAFDLTEEASGAQVPVVSVAVTDSSDNIAAFKAALLGALQGANMSNWLVGEARSDFEALFATDGIPAIYEGSSINGLAINNLDGDLSTGAAAMWTSISNGTADLLRLVALQLPPNRYDEAFGTQLPLDSTDTVLFRFHITQTYIVGTNANDLVANPTTPPHTDGAAPTLPASNVYSGHSVTRIVDILATLDA